MPAQSSSALTLSPTASMGTKAAALRADFGLPDDTPIPAVVAAVAAQLGVSLDGLPLVQQVDACYSGVNDTSPSRAPPVVQGVVVGDVDPDAPAHAWSGVVGIRAAPGTATGEAAGTGVALSAALPLSSGLPTRNTPVKQLFAQAIDIGAPAYNAGDHAGCYWLYRRCCEEAMARLTDVALLDCLQAALEQATAQARGAEEGEQEAPSRPLAGRLASRNAHGADLDETRRNVHAAWTLRRALDTVVRGSANPRLMGMPTPRGLWAQRGAEGGGDAAERPAPASTAAYLGSSVNSGICDAIEVGAPLYNAGNTAGCYYVYKRTAAEIIKRLVHQEVSIAREGVPTDPPPEKTPTTTLAPHGN